MAWIESHQGLARHIKTKRLARKLGISVPSTIGHLHLLWWWALDNLPDGNISSMEPEDIADEMMWNEDAVSLISALKEVGFLDDIEGELFIHDWHDYIGKLLEKRKKETDRKREYRAKTGQPKDEEGMSHGTGLGHVDEVPKDGGRNSTVPNQKKKTYSAEFSEFFMLYPNNKNKAKAEETFNKIINSGVDAALLIASARAYAAECRKNETELRFIAHATTFLNQKRYADYANKPTVVRFEKPEILYNGTPREGFGELQSRN